MQNKDIANAFRELARLMELHGENPFKIRSYSNAYMTLRKLDTPVAELDDDALSAIKGIGKAITGKIRELVDGGRMATLEQYREKTPPGLQALLGISGFGPKKVRTVWREMGIESVGELLYAVNENRLVEIKGFGIKTQEDLKKKLAYHQLSQGKFLYARLELRALAVEAQLQKAFPDARIARTGALRRADPILERVELLLAGAEPRAVADSLNRPDATVNDTTVTATTEEGIPLRVYCHAPSEWGSKQFRYTAAPAFLEAFLAAYPGVDFKGAEEEAAVFTKAGLPELPPELRETAWGLEIARADNVPRLIEPTDVRGVIHSHTTYSDGIHTLAEMAEHARAAGYAYIGITDHSKAAFYANGLSAERVRAQFAEIDRLNAEYSDFRILKGIESDILADGSLDYDEELLAEFDFVIASVHSNLRMDEEKATQRLLNAIAQPATSILGHPTGRLLLSRPGYPIDHRRVIDACADHGVAIELNASPYRLDLDWSWIPYALERGVLISINPDAHSREGIHDIRFGVLAARKGGLTAEQCLNAATTAEDFLGRLR